MNTKGESVKMNEVKKAFVSVLIAAIVFLGVTGCKQESEEPAGADSSKETASKDTASKEAAPKETPAGDHPAGDHPSGDHPK